MEMTTGVHHKIAKITFFIRYLNAFFLKESKYDLLGYMGQPRLCLYNMFYNGDAHCRVHHKIA